LCSIGHYNGENGTLLLEMIRKEMTDKKPDVQLLESQPFTICAVEVFELTVEIL
jgi:hypothetical protein